MNFLKTSVYTAISTATVYICGLIAAKVVAVRVGPAGIAMVGQFQNTLALLTMVGSGAINAGVVKYLSEYTGNQEKQQAVVSTALSIVTIASLVSSVFALCASHWLSVHAFNTAAYWYVYAIAALLLTFTTLNGIIHSFFNGRREIRRMTVSNIVASILGITLTVTMSYTAGIGGILISGSLASVLVFGVNAYFLRRMGGFSWRVDFKRFDNAVFKKLLTFSAMGVLSSFIIPIQQLIVRQRIIDKFSATEAGYWQSVTRISDYYLAFITTVLGVYYLPRLSEIKNSNELRNEIFSGYKIILPAVGLLALGIWLFRRHIVLIIFSPAFLPMQPLFTFQLIGDFIKIASWLLGYLMLAKVMFKTYVITELVFSTGFILLTYFFTDRYGLIGTTYAFALNFFLYLIVMIFVMRKRLFRAADDHAH